MPSEVQLAAVPDTLYRPGREARAEILAELAARWERHLPPLSIRALGQRLEIPESTIRYHLSGMVDDGLVHPEPPPWLTRAGYEAARHR